MGISITLNDVTNFNNQTTAANVINNNSDSIVTAFSSALDTAGDQMEGQLDMNSNHLVNLPLPASTTEPMRVLDAALLNGGGTITIEGVPSGGSTGYVLTKTSNTDFDTEWAPIPSINPGTANHLVFYSSASAVDPLTNVTVGGTTSAALSLGTSGHPGSLTLAGNTSGTLTIAVPGVAGSGTLTLPGGNTNFANTGGSSQVVMQTSSGGAFTVAQLSASSLSNGTTGTGSVVLSSSPTFTGNNFIPLNQIAQETQGYSLLGNTAGGTANYGPFQLTQLVNKAGPTSTDIMLISDQAAGGQLKQATIGNIVSAQVSGVASLNGETGTLSLVPVDGDVITTSGTNISIGGPGGMRNKIINGTMDIWQRGTTVNISAGGTAYASDRWLIASTSGGTAVTQQAGRQLTEYSMRLTGTASTSDVTLQQRIESYVSAALAGQQVTFQAWIFNNTASSLTPLISANFPSTQDNYSTASSVLSSDSTQSISTSSWGQIAYSFSCPTGVTKGLAVILDFGSSLNSTSNYLQITEVDLRATPGVSTGIVSSPSPAELRPIGLEDYLCKRYYEQVNIPIIQNPGGSTAALTQYVSFVPKRTTLSTANITTSYTTFNTSATTFFQSSQTYNSLGVQLINTVINGSIQNSNIKVNTEL